MTVHISVSRHEMEQIGVHRRCFVEPTFRERVLTVVNIALLLVTSCLVGTESIVCRTRIHVPHFAVATPVGGLEIVPQIIIRTLRMTFYHRPESRFQSTAFLSISRLIIGSAVVRTLRKHLHKHEQCSSKHDVSFSEIHILMFLVDCLVFQ